MQNGSEGQGLIHLLDPYLVYISACLQASGAGCGLGSDRSPIHKLTI